MYCKSRQLFVANEVMTRRRLSTATTVLNQNNFLLPSKHLHSQAFTLTKEASVCREPQLVKTQRTRGS